MRGFLPHERASLQALAVPGEAIFDAETLDTQEALRRVERYDVDPFDGSFRMRLTDLGRLALRLPVLP